MNRLPLARERDAVPERRRGLLACRRSGTGTRSSRSNIVLKDAAFVLSCRRNSAHSFDVSVCAAGCPSNCKVGSVDLVCRIHVGLPLQFVFGYSHDMLFCEDNLAKKLLIPPRILSSMIVVIHGGWLLGAFRLLVFIWFVCRRINRRKLAGRLNRNLLQYTRSA